MTTIKYHKISEKALVDLLLSNDQKSIEIIYDNYSSALYGIILRIIQKEEIAEDILQETFVKIWINASQYDASKGRLFTWLVNIARNLAIDKIRSKNYNDNSKNRPLEDVISYIDAYSNYSTNPDLIGLKELVEQLDSEQKKVIDLLYFGGLTQEEVSKKLEIPLGTVKTRARLAMIILRKKFEVSDSYK